MIDVYAVAPDGTEKTSVTADSVSKTAELVDAMDRCEVTLGRDAWATLDANLDRRNDRLVIVGPETSLATPFFAGRFDADERGDDTVTVTIESFERDALGAEPMAANLVYTNEPDSEIVHAILAQVPTLDAGTVETLAPTLSMSLSHAAPSKALRDVAEATGGELRYKYDRTVDYVARVGRDRQDGVTLSAADQTVIGSPTVQNDEREDVTHVRGFGAQSGPDQVTADGVADSYAGGVQNWREYENKEVIQTDRLQQIVDQLVAEYDGEPRHLDIKGLQTPLRAVGVGDRVHVALPAAEVDRPLRVLERTVTLDDDGAVTTLTVSNRKYTRENGGQSARKDLQRFNRGYEGFKDRSNLGQGTWQLVQASTNVAAELPYRYPDDVENEIGVTLDVAGRAWRSPVEPQPHTHDVDVTHPSHDHSVDVTHPSHDHTIDTTTPAGGAYVDHVNPLSYSWSTSGGATYTDTFDLPGVPGNAAYCYVFFTVQYRVDDNASGDVGAGDVRIRNLTKGADIEPYSGINSTYERGDQRLYQASQRGDVENDTIEVAFDVPSGYGGTYLFNYGGIVSGEHSHDVSDTSTAALGTTTTETSSAELGTTTSETSSSVTATDPTVITSFGGVTYYPEVDILVNGDTVAQNIGSADGAWSVTLDHELEDVLRAGENTITAEAVNGTQGEIMVALTTDLFRRGRTSN